MFLKKSLLFMTALALLMFTGQASAQEVTLTASGSATVSGSGTEIMVDVSQTGVTASAAAIEIVFDIDTDLVTLSSFSTPAGWTGLPVTGDNTVTVVNLSGGLPVPASMSFTFTTATDVTGMEFSIGITSIKADNVDLNAPLPNPIAFNASVDYAKNWWNALTADEMVAALFGDMATPEQVTAAQKMYDDLDADTQALVNAAAMSIYGAGMYSSVGEWWETLDCGKMRVAAGDGNTADPTSAFCAHYPGSGAARILDADALMRVNEVGQALLGRDNPGVYPPPAEPEGGKVYLTSDEVTIVRGKSAGDEIVVDVAVGGMDESFGAEITFMVDPPAAATRTGLDANNLQVLEEDGMSFTLAGIPVPRGAYGSVTFTAATDTEFKILVTSFNVLTREGKKAVDASGASVTVNKPLPTLTSDQEGDVVIMPGGSASAMVTAAGFGGDVTFDGAAEDGTVTASEPGEVTVTASDGIDPASASATINFVWGDLTLTADPEGAVTVMPGGTEMVTLMVSGQAEGAEVSLALGEGAEGVTLDAEAGTVSATGAGMGTVTASVGDVMSNSVDVVFEQGALTASADAESVTVLPGGMGMAMVSASGQAEGAEVAFRLEEGSEGATLDGAMVSASGTATAIVTAWVGDVGSEAVTIVFEQGALTASADATEVAIGPDGGSTTVSASGQAEGAEVAFRLEEGSEGATLDGAMVSASGTATAIVTAWVGDVGSEAVTVSFVPSLHTETPSVMFEDFGATAEASITAYGFAEDANIRFRITGGTGFATADAATTWTISTDKAGDVTMVAEDDMGNMTAPLTISFVDPAPYLTADPEIADVIIPDNGSAVVTVTATGLGDGIEWTVSEVTGIATVNIDTDGATATVTAQDSDDLSQTSTVTLIATDGSMTTESITITFRKMPELQPEMADVDVPQAMVPEGEQTVVAVGFPPDAEVTFSVEVTSGLESYVTHSQDGHVLTLSSTGTATVSVTATGGGVTTSAVEVSFEQALPAAPASVVVQDQAGDNGHYVMVSFANSDNHADVSQYRIYREMMVNTTMDADGKVVTTDEPVAAWVPWAVIDAMDNDDEKGMTRAVVPVTDATATRWGVAAEKGMASVEITPAGKRVFSKESVQQLVQFLGMDPNLVVTEDELAQMFMPSADYIKSLIGDQKNVVFAALDPDVSVLIGGDVAVPQNIRTDHGHGPIVSSPITATEGMVAAVDDTAPTMVTDVAADPDTGVITWTASADDDGMDAVMYRGHAIVIPHVTGYRVMASVVGSEAQPIDVTALVGGDLPPGSTGLTVPQALIESLIDQGVLAVMIDVVVMDGTNMTSIVPPLVVELAPKRKLFVGADGNPVFVVKLDRHGAMTPLLVDFEDFVAFTMAYNTSEATSTREEWRVFIQADLNDDTVVNFDDFILFFGSYGEMATGPAGKSLVTPVLGVNEAAEFLLRLGSDRVVAGENMFVDVSLANVQALMGYGFVLHYDAETFEFVEAVPATEDLLMSSGGETPLLRGWAPEAGQVHVMNAIVNGSEVSGDGDIVRLVFRVLRDFEDNARFEIANGLVFDPSQLANPLAGGVLDIQTTPTEFALLQNFPNPFNPETTIGYELAESADVTLQIYNVVGQVVRTLIAAEPQSVGRYQVRWDGMDDRGTSVSSGIYFYQISAGKFQDVRKLMLLK